MIKMRSRRGVQSLELMSEFARTDMVFTLPYESYKMQSLTCRHDEKSIRDSATDHELINE